MAGSSHRRPKKGRKDAVAPRTLSTEVVVSEVPVFPRLPKTVDQVDIERWERELEVHREKALKADLEGKPNALKAAEKAIGALEARIQEREDKVEAVQDAAEALWDELWGSPQHQLLDSSHSSRLVLASLCRTFGEFLFKPTPTMAAEVRAFAGAYGMHPEGLAKLRVTFSDAKEREQRLESRQKRQEQLKAAQERPASVLED